MKKIIDILPQVDFKQVSLVEYSHFLIHLSHNNTVIISQREMMCLIYFLLGYTSTQTASIISLAPQTVRTYLERVKRKLACDNRSDLMTLAYHSCILSLAFECLH